MRGLLNVLAGEGLELALVLTIVLAGGAVAVRICRSPVARQRLVQGTLGLAGFATLLWSLPLPRLAPRLSAPATVSSPVLPVELGPLDSVQAPSLGHAQIAVAPASKADAPQHEPTVLFASPEPRPQPVLFTRAEWLALGFLLGAMGFALHTAVSMGLLWRLTRRAQPAPGWVLSLASDTHGARVLVSNTARRPFCFGIGAGTIVLPISLVRDRRERRLRAVLLHEQAHLAQRHGRARLFAALVTPLLYWQPLFWWLVRVAHQDAELVADDLAASSMNKQDYASELLELVQSSQPAGWPAAFSLGAFGSRNHFLERMETLLMRTTPLTLRESRLQFVSRTTLGLVLLMGVSLAWGRVPQEDSAQQPQVSESPVVLTPAAKDSLPQDVAKSASPAYDPHGRAGNDIEFLMGNVGELRRFQRRIAQVGGQFAVTSIKRPGEDDDPVLGKGRLFNLTAQQQMSLTSFMNNKRFAVGNSLLAKQLAEKLNGVDTEILAASERLAELRHKRATLEVAQAAEAHRLQPNSFPTSAVTRQLWQMSSTIQGPATNPLAIQGFVIAITERAGVSFVTIDRGANHGVQVGGTFEVYLEATYKGGVEITHVNDSTSVGKITMAAQRLAVGDSATTDL